MKSYLNELSCNSLSSKLILNQINKIEDMDSGLAAFSEPIEISCLAMTPFFVLSMMIQH